MTDFTSPLLNLNQILYIQGITAATGDEPPGSREWVHCGCTYSVLTWIGLDSTFHNIIYLMVAVCGKR